MFKHLNNCYYYERIHPSYHRRNLYNLMSSKHLIEEFKLIKTLPFSWNRERFSFGTSVCFTSDVLLNSFHFMGKYKYSNTQIDPIENMKIGYKNFQITLHR